ncbi:NAD-dependent aldehyde dehydrogenase [Methanomethylovorans hollandica DSM 15978]|uniref:NAD-dependent aldehyde dehydrogenase n=1 Tax=Methanomethylovorans hollandica (strain DSM 15978 / NBRC 107637 / DMS1) TaxID=867904 RepID=L0KZH3_METHD|nr:NAD-dependent succinate-semialdehyde dehydrogenase [Methanomethylovorans hollandica]AGB50511.1 NAD-dependent aldehyde dehydrogenase [Methanomethylovorans hollandica DSM 15978]
MTLISSINPTTGKIIRQFQPYSNEQINAALKKADTVFHEWKDFDVSARSKLLSDLSQLLRSRKQELGELITLEMGKVIKQSVSEVVKCADTFDYFAAHAEEFMQPEEAETDASESMVSYEPMGPVLAIKPWNFPFWQVLSAASHILAAGNVVLLKHSSYVPMCALKMEELFLEAGFPDGVFQTLLTDGSTASSLISRDEIKAVSFTGGDIAGKKVAELAARNMKKFVLELGGSDPFIVLADADVEKATTVAVPSRCINTGQTCIAAKRFIVAQEVAEEFTGKFVELTEQLKLGDPMDKNTDIGPLVREEQISILGQQVEDAIAKGARPLLPGGKMEREGFFYSPTVLDNVNLDMKVMAEETFGPVAPIITVRNEQEAIRIANSTQFGLGASIWTKDREKGALLARQLETGMVAVNAFFRPEACMPFGGIKKSGMGREMAKHGFYEFMHLKAVKIY